MTEIFFEKYHGCGNDFIFISYEYLSVFKTLPSLRYFVKKICNRNFSVGADGVVFVEIKNKCINILIVNSSGSFAGTCGNALRCLGLKLLSAGAWNGQKKLEIYRLPLSAYMNCTEEQNKVSLGEEFIFKTTPFAILHRGTFTKTMSVPKLRTYGITGNIAVDMGFPQNVLSPKIECNKNKENKNFFKVPSTKKIIDVSLINNTFVQLANPHWVFMSQEFSAFTKKDFASFGKFAQKKLPGTVTNFSIPYSNISMLYLSNAKYQLTVYERGAGLTLACGSGATASAVACCLNTVQTSPEVSQHNLVFYLPGGTLKILHCSPSGNYILLGKAQFVFSGKINYET